MEPLTTAGQSDHGPPDPLPPGLSCRCSWPGCKYPEARDGYPEFTVVNKRDYCHHHAKLAQSGAAFTETVKPLVGTGDP